MEEARQDKLQPLGIQGAFPAPVRRGAAWLVSLAPDTLDQSDVSNQRAALGALSRLLLSARRLFAPAPASVLSTACTVLTVPTNPCSLRLF